MFPRPHPLDSDLLGISAFPLACCPDSLCVSQAPVLLSLSVCISTLPRTSFIPPFLPTCADGSWCPPFPGCPCPLSPHRFSLLFQGVNILKLSKEIRGSFTEFWDVDGSYQALISLSVKVSSLTCP